MADIEDLKSVLQEFNKKYPRPNLPPLTISSVYNIEKMYHEPYPNSDSPGVYIICHRTGMILRIGKAQRHQLKPRRVQNPVPAEAMGGVWSASS